MGIFGHHREHHRISPVSPDIGHFHLDTRKPDLRKKRGPLLAILVTVAVMGVEVLGGISEEPRRGG